MKVLIVKLTSMGDLVQALPALTDAKNAYPNITFDWAVDESFAEIARWHPAVRNTFSTAHRRWRKQIFSSDTHGEIRSFVRDLREVEYDVVIDAQTNWKSALVTRFARGPKHGPDSRSTSEWVAHLAYGQRHNIPKEQLAISRWRQLFAQALAYPHPTTPADFGLSKKTWPQPNIDVGIATPKAASLSPYLVFVQNASWTNKRWIDSHWQQLVKRAGEENYRVMMPWGSEQEKHQAEEIARDYDHCQVLPRLRLSEIAGLLVNSAGAVCVDTGLAHIAAALEVPTVTLYGATDPKLIAATGNRAQHLLASDYPCSPCYKRRCETSGYTGAQAQCMKTINAEQVWQTLVKLQSSSSLIETH